MSAQRCKVALLTEGFPTAPPCQRKYSRAGRKGSARKGTLCVKTCHSPEDCPKSVSRRTTIFGAVSAVATVCVKPGPGLADSFGLATAEDKETSEAIRRADLEFDPEIADDLWTDVIELDELNPQGWSRRGAVRLQLGEYDSALEDLEKAKKLYGVSIDAGTLNNLGTAQGQTGHWEDAAASFQASKILAEEQDMALDQEPRGGANRLSQKVALNLAFARFQIGDTSFAIGQTNLLLGEDPAYWDARAALTSFLWAQGKEEEAEEAWGQLCVPSGKLDAGAMWVSRNGTPDQPGAPAKGATMQSSTQQLYMGSLAGITKVLGKIEDLQLSNKCEDFESGLELPCDDAGIPGLGGLNEPCALYTQLVVEQRLWPPRAIESLVGFLEKEASLKAKLS
ncbi:hypothetical protein CYMTET_33276 [Cymbomonas tetramitiformis]|uniref:Uncharacterized protein n=1 Tax=Cymbomonas tetramitiformis TaxID=36881 RepID=A0AAE0FD64_9CHLO|nr:hypothetical protein CYMTET_33276 [Cymbomonas tetramitiformis]